MCVYRFFIHSSITGHLGRFRVSTTVNYAVLTLMGNRVELVFSFYLGICPEVGLLGHLLVLFLTALLSAVAAPGCVSASGAHGPSHPHLSASASLVTAVGQA